MQLRRDERALVRTVGTLADRPAEQRVWVVRRLTMPEKRTLNEFWPAWRHEGQAPPAFAGAGSEPSGEPGPASWLIMAGRGFGKTRAGAEWVSELARRHRDLRIALVGATIEDAVKVMVAGQSGLQAVARTGEEVRLNKTAGEVAFASGARAFLYSGACPEKLRGPEHHFAWCDEIAKWRYPEEAWDNLQLGLRLAPSTSSGGPQTLVTTTPKALAMMRRLVETSVVTRGRTVDNLNLPDLYVERMEAAYRGTRKGREELDGELIEDVEGALWTRRLIERRRADPVVARGSARNDEQGFVRIVVGVDPPGSAEGDACGIVACGLDAAGTGYVLGDHSVRGLSPEGWAAAVVAAAEGWGAECVIVEKNQGGDMVRSVLRAADAALPVRPVHARYGKGDRAEPVAMLFETGRARFAGAFPELEDELCAMTRGGGFAPGSWSGPGGRRRSPDRADAMVWALTELMLGREAGAPRVVAL